tara:strand:+ start:3439 stop:4203 length:765 start_codon:yes stop_codon:yes gene_type:complete
MANSTAYHSHYPCNEGSGVPADVAGVTSMDVGDLISNVWTNSGWVTTAGNQTSVPTPKNAGGLIIEPQPDFDLVQGDSLLMMFWVKMSSPTSGSEKIIGTIARNAEAGFNITSGGGSSDQTQLSIFSSESNSPQQVLSGRWLDGKVHHIAVAIDGATKFGQWFIDGVPAKDVDESGSLQNVVDLGGSTKNSNDEFYGYGISGDGSGNEESFEGQFRDIHTLVFNNSGLPHNVQEIVGWAMSNPHQTLPVSVVGV